MPNRFPREAALRDGRRLLVRPFVESDAGPLLEFFRSLPTEIRRFAWDDVADPAVVADWARSIDYGKVLPLVAFDGRRIVADATLHQRKGGPLRLVGRVKWLLDPEYRGAGLGTILVNEFISIGRERGLRHLACLLIAEQEADAAATLRNLGFEEHRFPGYGADPDGDPHDMVKLILPLTG